MHHTTHRLALLGTVLAAIVVLLGAFTRLSDAGLGCPDWPGCYGHIVVPQTAAQINITNSLYATTPLEPHKAWAEMVHRYFAGGLTLLIFSIGLIAFLRRQSLVVPIILIILVFFQALLGMWTVTLKLLPQVVMGHLLGGFSLLALLWLLALQTRNKTHPASPHHLRPWALLGLLIVILQIALGGWTSSNYAALACPDFPACQNSLMPSMDFKHAFNLLTPVGANFQGGMLDTTARVTIQMTHRYGALLTAIYIGLLALWLLLANNMHCLRFLGLLMLAVLSAQITLGILNVKWLLPLPIALAHNGCAALLLVVLVTLNYCVFSKPQRE